MKEPQTVLGDAKTAFELGNSQAAFSILHGRERAAEVQAIIDTLPDTPAIRQIFRGDQDDFGIRWKLAELAEALEAENHAANSDVEGGNRRAAVDLARRLRSRSEKIAEDARRARQLDEAFRGSRLRIVVPMDDEVAATAISLHERLVRIADELRAAEAEALRMRDALVIKNENDPITGFARVLATHFLAAGYTIEGDKRGDGFREALRCAVRAISIKAGSENRIKSAYDAVIAWQQQYSDKEDCGKYSGK